MTLALAILIFGLGLANSKGDPRTIAGILAAWLTTLPIAGVLAALLNTVVNKVSP